MLSTSLSIKVLVPCRVSVASLPVARLVVRTLRCSRDSSTPTSVMRVPITRCCKSRDNNCCRVCMPASWAMSSSMRCESMRASLDSSIKACAVLCSSLYWSISSGSNAALSSRLPRARIMVSARTSTTVSSSNRRFCTRRFCSNSSLERSASCLMRASMAAVCTDTSAETRNNSSMRCKFTRKAAAGGTGVATGACLLLSAGRIGTVRSASVTSVPGAGASACAETGTCSPCATR